MPERRREALSTVARARLDLDRGLERLEALHDEDHQRVTYSVHALNNYLMVVSATVNVLQRKVDPSDRDVKRLLESLKQATHLMASTARGVLTVRSHALPPLLFEHASLADIAEGACIAYREIARRKKVRITWRAGARRDRVLTDRVAAGAVLDNLLSNAVKYSSSGCSISVATAIKDEEVVCSVRDQGPGLSDEDQAQLFQRGVRLTAQPTAGEVSTGYGLAIANDLSTALGGRLQVKSVLGQGSCFSFTLPIAASVH
jgi:signal transduction histidine kinase